MSQVLKSADFTKTQKPRYLENKTFFLQIKNLINCASSTALWQWMVLYSRGGNLSLSTVTKNPFHNSPKIFCQIIFCLNFRSHCIIVFNWIRKELDCFVVSKQIVKHDSNCPIFMIIILFLLLCTYITKNEWKS